MNIVQISTADIGGGAENIALSLHGAYKNAGHSSRLVVGSKRSNDVDIIDLQNDRYRSPWSQYLTRIGNRLSPIQDAGGSATLARFLRNGLGQPRRALDIRQGKENFDFPGTWRVFDLLTASPDLVHCHNLHGSYFDLRALPWLSRRLPVFFTLHDPWLITGHCALPNHCERWRTGCGQCPDLSIYPAVKRDATAYNWRRKRDIFSQSDLYIAAPSKWLMRMVEDSILAPAVREARVIYNGVNTEIFQPGPQNEARRRLKLPLDARIILFSANHGLRNNQKNPSLLIKAFQELTSGSAGGDDIFLLVLGQSPETAPPELPKDRLIFRPFISEKSVIADYYRAADLLAYPSLADNCPMAIIEGMACGLPVVASAVGGIPELIDDGKTGFLVDRDDVAGFRSALALLTENERLRESVGKAAQLVVEARFDQRKMAQTYGDWYAEVVEGLRP